MADKSARFSLLLGALIVTFGATVLLINTTLFAIGSSLSGWSVPAAGIITISIGWWLCSNYFHENRRRIFTFVAVSLLIIFFAALLINSKIYDISFDGQTYHSDAIVSLANGWNPIKTDIPSNVYYPNWVGFFAKGNWILAAAMYRFTGNIESGKIFNSLLLIASGFFGFAGLSTFPQLSHRWRVNLSILIMLNPVSVCQLFTFYVDGQLASCLTILISLLMLMSQRQDKTMIAALMSVIIIMTNIKLTGILYAGIFIAGFLIWMWWKYRKQAVKMTMYCVVALGVGILVVGFNPVVNLFTRNFLERGDPFYPTSWSQLIAIDRNMPQDFVGKDRFSKLAISLFSKSQVNIAPSNLKLPFTFSVNELFDFRNPDVRTGGFGPLFSGFLILTSLIFVIGLIQYRSVSYTTFTTMLLILIVVSILSTSEGWWARYAPQLWLLPFLIIAINIRRSTTRLFRNLLRLSMFVLVFNVILIASVSIITLARDQRTVLAEYDTIKQIEQEYGPVSLTVNAFPITPARFDQQNIAYTLADKLPCPTDQQRSLTYSWSMICFPPKYSNPN